MRSDVQEKKKKKRKGKKKEKRKGKKEKERWRYVHNVENDTLWQLFVSDPPVDH